MRRIVLLLTFATAVALAPLSSGSTTATVQVSITRVGFVPATVTVRTGDTVVWTNADTRNRQVVSEAAGFASPVLRPTETFSFTFNRAGRFRYSDPLVSPRQRGTVVVETAVTVTLAAEPKIVRYGRSTVLSGRISTARANETVSIFAQRCRDTAFSKVGEAKTEANGTWTFGTKPLDRTNFRAQWGSVNSDPALVRVRPRITLAKLAAHRYRARVFAAQSFAGRSISFQRWNATRRVWVHVRWVVLRDTGLGIDPTEISGRDFRSSIRAGKRVRMRMGQPVAGTCYLANSSNVIFS
jgi:plastocyanin